MTLEEWRPVVGWEGLYEVSDQGGVRSVDRVIVDALARVRRLRSHVLRPATGGTDLPYARVELKRGPRTRTVRVHTLVAAAFIGPRPDGLVVCHNDGNSLNNYVSNLRYDTQTENLRDRLRHGTHPSAQPCCRKGHPRSPETLANGRCRICRRANDARVRARRKREMAA